MFSCTHVVERKPRGEKTLDKEESFASLDTSLSGNEHPLKDPERESITVVLLSNASMHLWQE